MTQQERFNLCSKWDRCNAPVCPLDFNVGCTQHIPGDRRCTKIVSYLDGTPLPDTLRKAIAESEPEWRKVLGDALLEKWVNGRKRVKEYFKNAGYDVTRDGVVSHTRLPKGKALCL